MVYIEKAYEHGSAEFEWIHLKGDGTQFPVQVTLSSMNNGEREFVLAFNKDLT